jgi:hypothetical protein
MKKIEFTHPALFDEKTEKPTLLMLPSRKIVCPCCGGEGHHFRSDLDENALIQGILEDGDDESLEMYRQGHFNQPCMDCKGLRVVDEIDWEYFHHKFPEHAKAISEWDREEAADRRYREMERRMGA